MKRFVVFVFCMTGWVLFRAVDIRDAVYWFNNCLCGIENLGQYIVNGLVDAGIAGITTFVPVCINIIILFYIDTVSYHTGLLAWINNKSAVSRYLLYVGMLLIIIFFQTSESTVFVYFQF